MISVLLVVGRAEELPAANAEMQALVNMDGLKIKLVYAATVQSLQEFNWQPGFDVVWLAGHGGVDGFVAADGVIGIGQLAQYLRRVGPQMIYLNSCNSVGVAQQLVDECGSSAICTIVDVPDVLAYSTGLLFAQYLSEGLDYREAYERSKPGMNRIYLYLEGVGGVNRNSSNNEETDLLGRLKYAVWGANERNGVVGDVKGIKSQLQSHDRRITALESSEDTRSLNEQRATTLGFWVVSAAAAGGLTVAITLLEFLYLVFRR